MAPPAEDLPPSTVARGGKTATRPVAATNEGSAGAQTPVASDKRREEGPVGGGKGSKAAIMKSGERMLSHQMTRALATIGRRAGVWRGRHQVADEEPRFHSWCPKAGRDRSATNAIDDPLAHELDRLRDKYRSLMGLLMTGEDEPYPPQGEGGRQPSHNPGYLGGEQAIVDTDDARELHLLPQLERLRGSRRYIPLRICEETAEDTRGELEMDEGVEIKPLYLAANNQGGCSAMTAHVLLRHEGGTGREQKMIVDSGAAHSAVDLGLLRNNFPEAYQAMTTQGMEVGFHDASGRIMPVAGQAELELRLGEKWITMRAIVFRHLSCGCLLGTNTLVEHGLVIDAAASLLYPKEDPDCHVALATTPGQARGHDGDLFHVGEDDHRGPEGTDTRYDSGDTTRRSSSWHLGRGECSVP